MRIIRDVRQACSPKTWVQLFRNRKLRIPLLTFFAMYGLCICISLFVLSAVYPLVKFEGYTTGTCPKLSVKDPNSMSEFFKRHVFQETPCVIEDAIDDWPALKLWNWDYLKSKIGNESVLINYANKTSPYFGPTFTKSKRMNFTEFARRIQDENDPYAYYFNQQYNETGGGGVYDFLTQHLKNDFFIPKWWLDYYSAYQTNLWLGRGIIRSAPHYDGSENFLVQVKGSKIFKVYPPSQSEYLYPNTDPKKPPHFSKIDVDAVDTETYPKFLLAKPTVCVASPGQILFVPPRWWHAVNSTDNPNFAVNFWFNPKNAPVSAGKWVNAIRYWWWN